MTSNNSQKSHNMTPKNNNNPKNLKNKHSLGQNWLKDRFILDDIAYLASSGPEAPLCLEIGPGLGTLTSALLRAFPAVISVEFDENLAKNLPKSFPGKNLKVICQDFLTFDLTSVPSPYVVAANIPYYITSPIIEKLLTSDNLPARIVLLVQKEVAERIACFRCKNSVLSLFVNNRASVSLGPVVGREFFTPVPKVDSQVIILDLLPTPVVSDDVLDFARICFRMPRKKLTANLATFMGLTREKALECVREASLPENSRPEDLSLTDWKTLANLIKKH